MIIVIAIIIKLNSILASLRENLTVQRPVTKLARVGGKKHQKTYKQNKNKAVYVIIIIIIPRKIEVIINR
jgi:hypothetical protein